MIGKENIKEFKLNLEKIELSNNKEYLLWKIS
jgi:hypothetical protein